MIEFRHLRYFIAVAEHLNFSRAAEALGTAQPSLSQQIRRLEDEVGVELFARDKRQIALTPAGEEFLSEARDLVAQLDSAVGHAREAERGLRGELRIAYTPTAMLCTLPATIREYRNGHPNVRISLDAMPPSAIFDALRKGEVDAGVLLEQGDGVSQPGIEVRRIGTLQTGVAVPASHRLAGRRSIRIEEIGSDTLILYARRLAGVYDAALALCRERGFTPAKIEEADRVESLLGLVAAGEGVTIGPRIYETMQFPGVRHLAITPAPKPFSMIVARNSEIRSTLVREFVATCERTRDCTKE